MPSQTEYIAGVKAMEDSKISPNTQKIIQADIVGFGGLCTELQDSLNSAVDRFWPRDCKQAFITLCVSITARSIHN